MTSRLATYILLGLFVLFQAQLWFGRGSVPHVWDLQRKLQSQEAKNSEAKRQFDQIQADVRDLKEGTDLVQEHARMELGMVKPNEVLIQYTK